jgi:hypothetical protein
MGSNRAIVGVPHRMAAAGVRDGKMTLAPRAARAAALSEHSVHARRCAVGAVRHRRDGAFLGMLGRMRGPGPSIPSDLRGASRLVIDLTLLVTELVEAMHRNIVRWPGAPGVAKVRRGKGLAGLAYRGVRGVTRLVGGGIDAALAPLVGLLSGPAAWPGREPVVAALNGVLGDHLEASGNPLAITMCLRVDGAAIELSRTGLAAAVPRARSRVVVMVHGLCMNDLAWRRSSHDHGQALARDLDASVLYLHYNTGLHISVNGARLDGLLEALVAQWPVPLDALHLVGHSMGGLVIRGACASARQRPAAWLQRLRAAVFLGSPHLGVPLERGGHGIDLLLAASPYTIAFTRLGRMRSAGITDLRHGAVVDADWHGRDRFAAGHVLRRPQPLPAGVACFAIAASLSRAAPRGGRSPYGDGLVPVASALGTHADRRLALGIPAARRWTLYGTGHLELLGSAPVYECMLAAIVSTQHAA